MSYMKPLIISRKPAAISMYGQNRFMVLARLFTKSKRITQPVKHLWGGGVNLDYKIRDGL